jgi:predicted nuclease of restriction endonuclease-like (RecB) superfamily
MSSDLIKRLSYAEFLNELKERIRTAQTKAVLSVNKELISLYWDIGRRIVESQKESAWGKGVVEKLAGDLRREFPDVKGFSARNLWDMRRFYLAYSDHLNLRQLVAEIPWGHNLAIINKVKDPSQRQWYLHQTIQNGWSRNVLVHQIASDLYGRQAAAIKTTNFSETLPSPQSELMEQTIKDPYIFDFITIGKDAKERELEKALIEKIRDFLLELGMGFAFMGSQYHLEVDGRDFYIDLLFYHHRLRCLVAIDLKMTDFMPEYAGKMNFYLSALDEMVRHPDDQSSVGIVLCKSKSGLVAEYSLRDGETDWCIRIQAHLPTA